MRTKKFLRRRPLYAVLTTMQALTLELNIALIPDESTAAHEIALSQEVARRHNAAIQLGDAARRLAMAPHLTIYMLCAPVAALPELDRRLAARASRTDPFDLACTEYGYHKEERSLERRYELTDELRELQDGIIADANPLRGGLLLERDPAGNLMEALAARDDLVGHHIRECGYWEKGELLRPHDTLNWLATGATFELATEPLPSLAGQRGRFAAVGCFALGPRGTTPQLIARYELGGAA